MRGLGISQASLAFSKHIVTQFGLHGKYFLCVLKKKISRVLKKTSAFSTETLCCFDFSFYLCRCNFGERILCSYIGFSLDYSVVLSVERTEFHGFSCDINKSPQFSQEKVVY